MLDQLRAIVGSAHVLTGADCAPYEQDWRKRYNGKALCAVRPADAEQVAAVVRLCAAYGAAIVTQGGNTGLCGGATPDASGVQVILLLTRLNTIRAIDTVNDTMTVEAGCILQTVQAAARDAGRLFALSLAAEGSCTIGGNLATNAGGTQVLRYGNSRELCLGLEVVTAQGEIWHGLRALRKDNTGYDLRDVFIGSEGTLGIITAAVLKTFALPRGQATAWVAVESFSNAVELLQLAKQQLGPTLTGFEAMNQRALALVRQHMPQLVQPLPLPAIHGYCVLLECSDHEDEVHAAQLFERLLERALELGLILDAAVSSNGQQQRTMWHIRESIPLAQAAEGQNIKHDVSLPISKLAEFVSSTQAALEQQFAGTTLVNFGHLGDGNLHFNVQAPKHIKADGFLATYQTAVNRLVHDAVHARGGSISAEHGLGQLKAQEITRYKSPLELALMRSLKQALDPQGLLNPGKVLML